MEKVKRERSANFNAEERDLLVSLVYKFCNVLENKQSDSSTWKMKEMAWSQIEKEFNAQCGGPFRSKKTLRIKYEGLKRTVRKKSASIRTELYRTGGGPNTAAPLDSTEIRLKSMIGLSTDGMESLYDSDVLPSIQNEDLELSTEDYIVFPSTSGDSEQLTKEDISQLDAPVVDEDVNEESLLNNDLNDAQPLKEQDEVPNEKSLPSRDVILENVPCDSTPPSQKKWDITSRKNLKTKRHPALIAHTLESKKNKFEILTEKKLELVKLQKEILEAEFLEKKKEWEFNAQERQQKLAEANKEYEFNEKQRKWKEEEHMLKIAKLKKELNN